MAFNPFGKMSAIFSMSFSFTGVEKSWQFIRRFAQKEIASDIFGWQWPSEVT
jgi:hypothetical protein